jgi:hypothetical protein
MYECTIQIAQEHLGRFICHAKYQGTANIITFTHRLLGTSAAATQPSHDDDIANTDHTTQGACHNSPFEGAKGLVSEYSNTLTRSFKVYSEVQRLRPLEGAFVDLLHVLVREH